MSGRARFPLWPVALLCGLLVSGAALTRLRDVEPAGSGVGVAEAGALGAFKGVALQLLWLEAHAASIGGDHDSLGSAYAAVARLQPWQERGWLFRAWDMGVNVAGAQSDPASADRWFRRGLDHLRLEAETALPDSSAIPMLVSDLMLDGVPGNARRRAALGEELAFVFPANAPPAEQARRLAELDASTMDEIRLASGLRAEAMLRLDRDFGPLDWLDWSSHCLYWAVAAWERAERPDDLACALTVAGAMLAVIERDAGEKDAAGARYGAFLAWMDSERGFGRDGAGEEMAGVRRMFAVRAKAVMEK